MFAREHYAGERREPLKLIGALLCVVLTLLSFGCDGEPSERQVASALPGVEECSPPGAYRCNPDDPATLQLCDPLSSKDWTDLERCSSAELCDANAGACLKCTPNQYQCAAWELQQCAMDGSGWNVRRSCENEQYCDRAAAQCAVCLAGTTYCGGDNLSTLYVCNLGRTGYTATECERAGDCSTTSMACRACVEGEYQCNKTELQRCNAGQEWEVQDSCASEALCQQTRDLLLTDVARPATCEEPACVAGTHMCAIDDGRNLLGCPPSQDAWAVVDVCETPVLCEQGIAAGACPEESCEPGTPRCTGAELQVCNTDGTDYEILKTCKSADECNVPALDCVPCTPGSGQCNGALRQECTPEQTWTTVEVCASASLCTASEGTPVTTVCATSVCSDDEYHCDGANLEMCRSDRMGFTPVKACDSPALCNATDARCDVAGCPGVGQTRCQNNVLQTCPDTLRDWNVVEACSAGTVCDLESLGCASTCPDPPYRCNNTQPEQCVEGTAGISWEVVSAPCATAALCQADSAGASCVVPACGGALPDYRCSAQVAERCNAGRTGWESTLTCAAGTFCDPGPDNEGPAQCDVCDPDSYACDRGNLMHCEPNGLSLATIANCRDAAHCVASGLVSNSYCLVCDAGETQCNGANVEVCSADRRSWVQQDQCDPDNGCHEDADGPAHCSGCSAPGAKQCDGTELLTCDADQTAWGSPEDCEFGCKTDAEGDYCRDCEPNSVECSADDDNKSRTCDSAGHWGSYMACPDDSVCYSSGAGDYCGTCDHDNSSCVSSTVLQTCDDGAPGPVEDCPEETPYCLATAGSCVECNPSAEPECAGTAGGPRRQVCSEDGAWEADDCTEDGSEVCLDGECVACSPAGPAECTGVTPGGRQVCTADGTWMAQACSMMALPVCYGGDCVECNPMTASPRCTGSDTPGRQTCDMTGHWVAANCTGSNLCVAGSCQACNPATQPAECTGAAGTSGRRQCTAGAWADATCSAPTPVCTPGATGMAAQCGCQESDTACNGSVLQTCSAGAWSNQPGTACTACTSNGTCAGQTPACNGEWCVQCTTASHALCAGTTPVCGTNNSCRACVAGECGASMVCDTGTGACVECTASDASKCTGTKPVCDASYVCRACGADSECPMTCDVTGACL